MSTPANRYSPVAIALHWIIAICIVSMVPMGLWMTSAIQHPDTQATAYRVFQIHKSVGFLILALTVLRIFWRLTHPAPALPAGMKPWEAFAARATHATLYGLMLALPLTGWLYVSTGWAAGPDRALAVPTSWFGLFTIPALPWIGEAAAAVRRAVAFQALGAHSMLAWTATGLVALHVGAALKHHFYDRDGVLAQMAPVFDRGGAGAATQVVVGNRWPERCAGFGLVLIVAGAAAIAATPSPRLAPTLGPPAITQTAARSPAYNAPASTSSASTTATGRAAPTAANSPAPTGASLEAVQRATGWTIDPAASHIAFAGTHSGDAFRGRFEKWEGQIWFDPQNLAGSKAAILISTASAKTGDATQEGALEGEEWLDPAAWPLARFEASEFRALGGDRFEASGFLTIRTVRLPIVLPFTFEDRDGVATVRGKVVLDRNAFGLGMQSDASNDWVSRSIDVTIEVIAHRDATGDATRQDTGQAG